MRATWGGLHGEPRYKGFGHGHWIWGPPCLLTKDPISKGRILGLWVDIKSGALQVVSPDFSTVRTILCDCECLFSNGLTECGLS